MSADKAGLNPATVVVRDVRELPTSIDDAIKQQQASDKSAALKLVLDEWSNQQKSERELRGSYANWLLIFLFAQIVAVNAAFFFIGFKWLQVDEWTSRLFIMAVFSELSAMVFFIVKYLFSKAEDRMMELIEKLHTATKP